MIVHRRAAATGTVAAALLLVALPAGAQETVPDSGDTAWLVTATALVLFMTLPGLALFYGGLVRARGLLFVLAQCTGIAALASILSLLLGYSLAFDGDGHLLGGRGKALLPGVPRDAVAGTVPESVFFTFQLTFAVITPALIVGACVERIRFSAVLLLSGLCLLLVYVPVAHWVWGGGFLADMGTLDFAGGIVVHATAGAAALAVAKVLGPRRGLPSQLALPHSPGPTMAGAAMLRVGWFGSTRAARWPPTVPPAWRCW